MYRELFLTYQWLYVMIKAIEYGTLCTIYLLAGRNILRFTRRFNRFIVEADDNQQEISIS